MKSYLLLITLKQISNRIQNREIITLLNLINWKIDLLIGT